MIVRGSCHLKGFNAGLKLSCEGGGILFGCGENRGRCLPSPSKWGFDVNVSLPEPSQRSVWHSVNKETKGEKCLIVLEKDVPQFFNIFCPDAQRYCSRVGGMGRCVWQGCCLCRVMGHYSRAIDFITVPLTYSSLTLSKCPCQLLIHLIPWLSILMAFGQKGQYFLWRAPELYKNDSRKEEAAVIKAVPKGWKHDVLQSYIASWLHKIVIVHTLTGIL